MPKKIILCCDFPPGDVVLLTSAVRDLHLCYPGEYVTDVRTRYPEFWENNPYISVLNEDERKAQTLACSYPLINQSNTIPFHVIHGFIEYLNESLNLNIRATAFNGDIHLSKEEMSWFSQIHELVGEDFPFWIIVAGGKFDVTIKWWDIRRYQEVVDYFRGKIQFVQVGADEHYHPALQGVIDLRGKTNLRELVRLVYHAQGVVCPVTLLMHLAAAVPVKGEIPKNRPCVVIAGGREPSQWEAYPHQQFIHTNDEACCGGDHALRCVGHESE